MEDDTRPQQDRGGALAEQLNQTTSPDAGATVSGSADTEARIPSNFEILFEAEEDEPDKG